MLGRLRDGAVVELPPAFVERCATLRDLRDASCESGEVALLGVLNADALAVLLAADAAGWGATPPLASENEALQAAARVLRDELLREEARARPRMPSRALLCDGLQLTPCRRHAPERGCCAARRRHRRRKLLGPRRAAQRAVRRPRCRRCPGQRCGGPARAPAPSGRPSRPRDRVEGSALCHAAASRGAQCGGRRGCTHLAAGVALPRLAALRLYAPAELCCAGGCPDVRVVGVRRAGGRPAAPDGARPPAGHSHTRAPFR